MSKKAILRKVPVLYLIKQLPAISDGAIIFEAEEFKLELKVDYVITGIIGWYTIFIHIGDQAGILGIVDNFKANPKFEPADMKFPDIVYQLLDKYF